MKANTSKNWAGGINSSMKQVWFKNMESTWSMKGADTHKLQRIVTWKCSVARSCDFSREVRNLDIPVKLPSVFSVGN